METSYNFSNEEPREAMRILREIIEEVSFEQTSVDIHLICGQNKEVSGTILKYLDREEISHDVDLKGNIFISLEYYG